MACNKCSIVVIFIIALALPGRSAEAQSARKRALVIGVQNYEKAGFTNLEFPEADARSLEGVLTAAGFDVTLMLGSYDNDNPLRATWANISGQLRSADELQELRRSDPSLKPGFVAGLGELGKNDITLVALAGHGRQKAVSIDQLKRNVPFFCPADAHRTNQDTWISINHLMKKVALESGSLNNLILVDACRDNPSRGRGIDGASVSLPEDNLAVCFSSSSGTEAYESKKLGHGIFSYFVLKGLAGEAANRQNQVTWDTLVGYVSTQVSRQAPNLVGAEQLPNLVSNRKGASPVLVHAKPIGSGQQAEIARLQAELKKVQTSPAQSLTPSAPPSRSVQGPPPNDPEAITVYLKPYHPYLTGMQGPGESRGPMNTPGLVSVALRSVDSALHGTLKVGNTAFPICYQISKPNGVANVSIDLNRDQKYSPNETKRVTYNSDFREYRHKVMLSVPSGSRSLVPYPIQCFFRPAAPTKMYWDSGWMEGQFKMRNRTAYVYMYDWQRDGKFTSADTWGISFDRETMFGFPLLAGPNEVQPNYTFKLGEHIVLEGLAYKPTVFSEDGSWISFKPFRTR